MGVQREVGCQIGRNISFPSFYINGFVFLAFAYTLKFAVVCKIVITLMIVEKRLCYVKMLKYPHWHVIFKMTKWYPNSFDFWEKNTVWKIPFFFLYNLLCSIWAGSIERRWKMGDIASFSFLFPFFLLWSISLLAENVFLGASTLAI